jgi:acid stress-induced BolA-like protein IbaG/YrbA
MLKQMMIDVVNAFDPDASCEIDIGDSENWVITVVSDRFSGLSQIDRQELIWEHYNRFLSQLGLSEIAATFTLTHAENDEIMEDCDEEMIETEEDLFVDDLIYLAKRVRGANGQRRYALLDSIILLIESELLFIDGGNQ